MGVGGGKTEAEEGSSCSVAEAEEPFSGCHQPLSSCPLFQGGMVTDCCQVYFPPDQVLKEQGSYHVASPSLLAPMSSTIVMYVAPTELCSFFVELGAQV